MTNLDDRVPKKCPSCGSANIEYAIVFCDDCGVAQQHPSMKLKTDDRDGDAPKSDPLYGSVVGGDSADNTPDEGDDLVECPYCGVGKPMAEYHESSDMCLSCAAERLMPKPVQDGDAPKDDTEIRPVLQWLTDDGVNKAVKKYADELTDLAREIGEDGKFEQRAARGAEHLKVLMDYGCRAARAAIDHMQIKVAMERRYSSNTQGRKQHPTTRARYQKTL